MELTLAQSYRQTRHFSDAEDYLQRAIEDGEDGPTDGSVGPASAG